MVDIKDFLSSYITIKRAGRYYKALCPFHNEKSASFTIYDDTQSYYCFGCGKGGSILNFIMEYENLQYVDAIRFLANRQGVVVPDDNGQESEFARTKAVVYEINKETAKFFFRCLKTPYGKIGYDYFKGRGLDDGIIKVFALGYAPDSWNALFDYLSKKGFKASDLVSANVVAIGKNGSYYDVFRNRAMFPIIDLRGNILGFGGRVLDDSKPKYINTSDTPVYSKSQHLYGLNLAKKEIDNQTLILCEGYMDVVALHSAGFKNSVAGLGTAFTSEQARLLSKYSSKVIVAYDSDEAGKTATRRVFNILDDVDVSASVLKIDDAKDPDEYIKKFGKVRFKLLLDETDNLTQYELDELKNKYDLNTNEGKIEFTKKAVYILANIKNKIERDVYINNIAADTGVVSGTILQQVNAIIIKKNKNADNSHWNNIQQNRDVYADKINTEKGKNISEAVVEENIIAFLFRNSDVFGATVKNLSPNDFVTQFNSRVYNMLIHLNAQDLELSINNFANDFTNDECNAIARIIARNDISTNEQVELDKYIEQLKNYKEQNKFKDIQNLQDDDMEAYRQKRNHDNRNSKEG